MDFFFPMGLRESRIGILIVVFIAIFTDVTVYGVVLPILPTILAKIGVAENDLDIYNSLLFGLYAVGLFFATPIFGALSDHYGSRTFPMLMGMLAMALTTILFALSNSLTLLIIARIAQGVSAAASWVIGLAILADVYPKDKLGGAMGIVLSGNTLGYLMGPLIGGAMGEYVSLESPFYVCAGLAAFDFLGRLLIRVPSAETETCSVSPENGVHDVNESTENLIDETERLPQQDTKKSASFRDLLSIPQIWIYSLGIILGSSSFSAFEGIFAIYMNERFKSSQSEIGLLFTAVIFPNIVVSAFVGHLSDRYPRHLIMSIGMILHSASAPFVILAPNIPLLVPALMAFGSSASILNTPSMPEMTAIVERHNYKASNAQVYAIFNAAYSVGMLIGPIIAASVKVHISPLISICLFPIFIIIYAPVFYLFNVKILSQIHS